MGLACSDSSAEESYVPFDPEKSIFTPLFSNSHVRDLAASVSARLATLYDSLSDLYPVISLDFGD